jgi:hypothetical protein
MKSEYAQGIACGAALAKTYVEQLPSAQPEIIRCKDCKHRPVRPEDAYYYEDILFPDEECPCICADPYYSWTPEDDWFCPKGERKEE